MCGIVLVRVARVGVERMLELSGQLLGLLRSTEGSLTEDELAARTAASVGEVRSVLEDLALTGAVFHVRYRGDPEDHWRASDPAAFRPTDGRGLDPAAGEAVRSVLSASDWALSDRQIADATGVEPRTIRAMLEGLFLRNAVIRVRYRGDPTVYWRAAGIRARPAP